MSRLEKLTNIAVLITCAVVVAFFGRYFYLSHTGAAASSGISRGRHIELPGDSQPKAGPTLVMALSTECHFCKDSMPFYRKLTAFHQSAPGSPRLVAVLPQPVAEGRAYLQLNGISVDTVLSQPLGQMGVNAVPMLLLLDRQNKVEEIWDGLLNPAQQEDVLSALKKSCAACTVSAATGPTTQPSSALPSPSQ